MSDRYSADQIQVLTGFEAVRKRPGMYIGYLNAGINITLQDNYFYHKNIYFNYPQGMKDYLVEINQNREIINSEVIHIQGKETDIIVEVVLQWCSDRPEETFFNTLPGLVFYREWQYRYGKESQEIIEDAIHLLSFANYTYTFLQGTHVDGVKQGIVQSFNNICSKVYPERELQPTWTKLSSGLTGVVSVMLTEPEFEGPIKWKLANSEVNNIVSNLVASHLSQYLEAHPQMIDRIVL